jgi:hypothetical protein
MDLEPLKNAFWAIVADCLETFHGYSPETARCRVQKFRERVENPPAPFEEDGELIYHDEPFYIANDLAQRELPVNEHGDEYARIMARHYAPAEALANLGDRKKSAALRIAR